MEKKKSKKRVSKKRIKRKKKIKKGLQTLPEIGNLKQSQTNQNANEVNMQLGVANCKIAIGRVSNEMRM